jgi:RND family efflux transporter MFP subunit
MLNRIVTAISPLVALLLATTSALADEAEDFDCVIQPKEVVELSSPVPGIIETIDVDRSDSVEQGQVVAKLKDGVEQALVDLGQQRAGFTGEIESKKASLDFAKRKQKRTKQLYSKKAVPFHVLDEAQTESVLAATELRHAQQNKRLAELELKRAQETLDLRTVRSPISGVVVERLQSPGEFVENKPILRIAQLDPLRVEVILPVALFGSITTGMRAEVVPELSKKRKYIGQVTIVDRVVDAASGTFGVRLELPNPGNYIPGGLRCKLHFNQLDASPLNS